MTQEEIDELNKEAEFQLQEDREEYLKMVCEGIELHKKEIYDTGRKRFIIERPLYKVAL